jgi:hypothetical protein
MVVSNKGPILNLSNTLRGEQMLALDMLRTSAVIIGTAQRLGYLDEALELRVYRLRTNKMGNVPGFQSGVVSHVGDLIEEVKFWKRGGAELCIDIIGITSVDTLTLLKMLSSKGVKGYKRPTPIRPNSFLAN